MSGLLSFPVETNRFATRWAKLRSSTLVTDVTAMQRATLRRIIGLAFDEHMPPAEAARMIRTVVGLTDAQADAVWNLRKTMLTNPGRLVYAGQQAIRVPKNPTFDFIEKMAARYSQRLLTYRSENIARTETLAASNAGQQGLWLSAAKQGVLELEDPRKWLTAKSERTCEVCRSMHGQIVALTEPFVLPDGTKIMNPPAHPSCRCGQGLHVEAFVAAAARTGWTFRVLVSSLGIPFKGGTPEYHKAYNKLKAQKKKEQIAQLKQQIASHGSDFPQPVPPKSSIGEHPVDPQTGKIGLSPAEKAALQPNPPLPPPAYPATAKFEPMPPASSGLPNPDGGVYFPDKWQEKVSAKDALGNDVTVGVVTTAKPGGPVVGTPVGTPKPGSTSGKVAFANGTWGVANPNVPALAPNPGAKSYFDPSKVAPPAPPKMSNYQKQKLKKQSPDYEDPKKGADYWQSPTGGSYSIDLPDGTKKTIERWTSGGKPTENLTVGEHKALGSYQGSGYSAINSHLRGGGEPTPKIKALDRAFDKQVPSTEEGFVFRKMGGHLADKMIASYNEKGPGNAVFRDKGFSSSSYAPGGWSGNVQFTIRVPKGSKAIDMNAVRGSHSSHSSEKEILLPRGMRYRITAYQEVELTGYGGAKSKAHRFFVDAIFPERWGGPAHEGEHFD